MQKISRIPYFALLAGLGLGLFSACSPAPETTPDVMTDSEEASVAAPATAATDDFPTKAEILEEYAAGMRIAEATQGAGAPALWRLADADTEIYLFGTVHMLRPELEWRTPVISAAFDAADTIVFEVDMKSEAAQKKIMSDFLSRGMYEGGRTLSATLEGDVETAVSDAFESIGVPYSAVDVLEPWMASINLGAMKLTADGFDPNSGVESIFEAEANAAGKGFGFLEEISDQADAFDLLSERDQIEMLYSTALTLEESSTMLDRLVDEWADGDVVGLTALVGSPDSTGLNDALYDSVLVNRNAKWTPKIEAMLDTPGTVFIAVGAAHLVGPDSVVTMLRDKGYEVTSLSTAS